MSIRTYMVFSVISTIFKKKIARNILVIVFMFLQCELYAQNLGVSETISFQGTVYAQGEPVSYANVYLKGTNIGTVTNLVGGFLLRVPIEYKSQMTAIVIISCIGFESKKITLEELIKQKSIISINTATHLLPELVIEAKNDSAVIILERAIANIKNNFPHKRHLIEAFYRELSIKDTIYTRLIEAAILVDEPNYKGSSVNSDNLSVEGNKVRIIEMRKSEDNRDYDLVGWAYTKIFGEKNDIYGILDDNYVRFIGKKNDHFLSKKFLLEYNIQIDDVTSFEGRPVVVLKLNSKNGDIFFTREVTIYIDKTDFGILKIEYSLLVDQSRKDLVKAAIDQKYFYKSIVSYKKIEGTYVPYYIHTRKYASNTNPLKDGSLQYSSIEFLLTHFFYDDYDRIKAKYALSKDLDINKSDIKNNEQFWKNYSTVQLNPLSKKAIHDLEKENSLDSQFKKN